MNQSILICLLLIFCIRISVTVAFTNPQDVAALRSLMNLWQIKPPSWKCGDPCGKIWEGIGCANSRVTSITLASMGLKGQLSDDIQFLSELQTLDLSYNKGLTGPLPPSIGSLQKLKNLILAGCSFFGPIPDTIGYLKQLVFLSLDSNSFSGSIPASIGNLSNLYWLDLTDNKLSGSIPVSSANTYGLDMLIHTKHFHFGDNQLSGSIPPKLFSSNMALIHVLLNSNKLTGSIPSTLGLIKTLEILRLDQNMLNGSVPLNLNNLTSVGQLFLCNNQLSGPLPNLTGMNNLKYLDLSNNSFQASDFPPWVSDLEPLMTLEMENTELQGSVPVSLFSTPQLESVNLRNNELNGTLDIGTDYSRHLQLIDLQSNYISGIVERGGYSNKIMLARNPVCDKRGWQSQYCLGSQQSTPLYSTAANNCIPIICPSDQKSSPNCRCSYPYMGTLYFRAPSFSDLGKSSYYFTLEKSLMDTFQTYNLPVDSVSVSKPMKNSDKYLELSLQIFPSGKERFSRFDISAIGSTFSNQTFTSPEPFGPFTFIGSEYRNFAGFYILCSLEATTELKKSSIGIILGATAGGVVLLLICAGFYTLHQKRITKINSERNQVFASWDPSSGSIPELKGSRCFSFEELEKCTNNFSEFCEIGSGSYGKVYSGTLATGEPVAIKRAQKESMQGDTEFKNEIELLSRIHHKNLVSLMGFCFEKGEQTLVYEYIPNGTLRDSLSGKSRFQLDWKRRLRVALGSAIGLAYLHEQKNPPIIHRNIKSANILIDFQLNAKVSDFGLSKLGDDEEKDHVTAQIKGTTGYLDPEYCVSQRLTEKSDVYSFGVLMLELITARRPIEQGRYIVRDVRMAMDKKKDLYGLHELLDPAIVSGNALAGFEKFVDLAMSCVEESRADRPFMSDVVKEIESIMLLAGLDPKC